MKKFTKKYMIAAPLSAVWEALADAKTIDDWGAGPAVMEARDGGEFSLWGGDIYGINTEVIKEKVLTQDWFQKGWENPSRVEFQLTQDNDKTIVTLVHSNIPDTDFGDIKEGWDAYYMTPLAEFVESQ